MNPMQYSTMSEDGIHQGIGEVLCYEARPQQDRFDSAAS